MIAQGGIDQPIEALNLNIRAYSCLKHAGIHTIGQLLGLSKRQLLSVRNFGQRSYDEVKGKLIKGGFMSHDNLIGPFAEDK